MNRFDQLVSLALKPWAIILMPVLLFLLCLYIDVPVATYFITKYLNQRAPLLYWFTKLGLGILYLLGFLLAALWFRFVSKNKLWEERCWFLWLAVVFPSVLCLILKVLAGRARPDLWFGWQVFGFYGVKFNAFYWSFPSGHTATMMGLVFGLALVFPKYDIFWMVFGLLVAISRVLLVQHYLSDIVGAAWLALLEVALLRWYVHKRGFFREVRL